MPGAHHERNSEPRPAGPLFVWTAAEPSLSIEIPLELVDRLHREVLEGFKSVPRRGLEIGGFLLGRTELREGATIIRIEAAEALSCEHRYGPSYLLSEADWPGVEQRLAAAASGPPQIVGFYRSQTRQASIAVHSEDERFLSRWFRQGPRAFLLIRPAAGQGSSAAFFWCQDGVLRGDAAGKEFPFHSGQLLSGGYAIRQEAVLEAAASAAPAVADPPRPASRAVVEAFAEEIEPRRERRRPSTKRMNWPRSAAFRWPQWRAREWRWPELRPGLWRNALARRTWIPVSAAALLLLFGFAVLLWRGRGVPDPSRRSVLALAVSSDAGALRLVWDRDAAIVRAARGAVLSISDGSRQSHLNLDAQELHTGSITYWPEQNDVNFRLEVEGPGSRRTVESVRAIRPVIPPSGAVAPSAVPASAAAPRPADARPSAFAARHAEEEDEPEPEAPRVWKPTSALPAEAPKTAAVTRPAPAIPPEPPPISPPAPAARPMPSESVAAPQEPPAPFASVTVSAPEPSSISRVVGKIPLLRRLRPNRREPVVPPRPVHEVMPTVPPQVRRMVREEVPVDVRVYVTDSGSVEYAELVSGGMGAYEQLGTLAVYAARRWTFSPARSGSRKVPGEAVLHFRFGPQSVASR